MLEPELLATHAREYYSQNSAIQSLEREVQNLKLELSIVYDAILRLNKGVDFLLKEKSDEILQA